MQTQIKKRQRKLKGFRLEEELSDHISYEAGKLGISDNDPGCICKRCKRKRQEVKA